MGRNKQNEKAKKDGKHRRETKEEKKERLKNAQEAREVSSTWFVMTTSGFGGLILTILTFKKWLATT